MKDMREDIDHILFTEEQLHARVRELGAEITEKYADKNPLIVGILRGCFVFMSDLVREIKTPCMVDFMAVSSYEGSVSKGSVKIKKDMSEDVLDRHVIIVEDILDTGTTLYNLKNLLMTRSPASLAIATLLDKPSRRTADIEADFVGYQVPNEFVVGYGLDYNEEYRNLPYIGVLKPEIYTK